MNELVVRSLAGAAMMVVALACAVLGGYYFAFLVAAAATIMFYEWSRIVRGWVYEQLIERLKRPDALQRHPSHVVHRCIGGDAVQPHPRRVPCLANRPECQQHGLHGRWIEYPGVLLAARRVGFDCCASHRTISL
jgi:hypothetical protein